MRRRQIATSKSTSTGDVRPTTEKEKKKYNLHDYSPYSLQEGANKEEPPQEDWKHLAFLFGGVASFMVVAAVILGFYGMKLQSQ
mmetsp:Transcript_20916/g.25201  ORF Transcript_20916/g.25201 Transcript_20916/m.25201 type:complete len:84 (-) Transcript_20916:573-824(-)|eukprot:CAMPEP_0195254402 /NCGR_PEP_ID=MMETSP0706-20130129/5039_1 /TAXON_ID=33640 /ORGANISM="Asterionellopsis glacialis, Strain CCMP134" /LENGTH=83 /DNA_ID=CAMNT_0040307087 /DNA_START=166 /DNA_END=417 /DNA_ORIENTATION=-